MDLMFVIIAVVVIATISITIYFLFNRSVNKNKVTEGELLESNDSPQIELPWKVQSYESTDFTLYHQPESLIITDQFKNHLGNIVKFSPIATDIVKNEKRVVVKFTEEVLQKMKNGELKIMRKKDSLNQFRPIAVDKNNIVRSHGWLEVKNKIKANPAQLANAVLGVMTIVTAQEHLDQINKQLKIIDKKIDRMLQQYNNDKFGIIRGNIRYLQSILPGIHSQDKKLQVYLTKLEDISLTSYKELESILREFPLLKHEASRLKAEAKFGINKIINEMKEFILEFEQKTLIGYGNLEVISVCLKLINELGSNSEISMNRLSDIENYYQQLTEHHDQIESILNDKNLGLKALFRTSKTVDNKKEEIKKHLLYHNENIHKNRSAVNEHIYSLKNGDAESVDGPINLQVEYNEEGKITAVYKMREKI